MSELEISFHFLRTIFLLLLLASSLPSAYTDLPNDDHSVDGDVKQSQLVEKQKCANINHDDNNKYANDQVGDFENFNELCEEYASIGECDINPKYMHMTCRKSCRKFYKDYDNSSCLPINQCGLYLATSSIPNAGLGIYTTETLSPLTDISHPDIVINTVDIGYHQQLHKEFRRQENYKWSEQDSNGLSDTHIKCREWSRVGECEKNPNYMLNSCKRSCTEESKGVDKYIDCGKWAWEGECENNANFMLNFCKKSCTEIPISHPYNGHWWLPKSYFWQPQYTHSIYDARQVESLIMGIGAICNSHLGLVNAQLNAHPYVDTAGLQRDVDPGAGAYSATHGLSYFTTSTVPAGMELFTDYGESWFVERTEELGSIPLSSDYSLADKVLSAFVKFADSKQENRNDNSFAKELLSFVRNDLVPRDRTRSVIPSILQEAKEAQKKGTALHSVPNAIRSREWLEQNGQCLDNIAPRPSTILAGRGAIAMRPLLKGDVVAPAPMLHIRRSDLHMYSHRSAEQIKHLQEQLLLNYCYGHPESSMLLLPYSPATSFINTNLDKSTINTRIQWSAMPNHHNKWLDLSVEEVLSNHHAGLMMEFVATRDIAKGDEIFIDYGNNWKQAWNLHLNQWTPYDIDNYARVEILNAKEDEIRTVEEQMNNPYADNALIICFVPTILWDFSTKPVRFEVDWYNHSHMLRHIANSRKCSILEKYTKPENYERTLYMVAIKSRGGHTIRIKDIPRHAIRFVDNLYSADQYNITNAFRHEIGIPDEIFPKTWRDLKPTQ